ncbi:MAG: hypothetical protein IPM76_23260 [Chloroflexi bacterium]|nr:hypothetical protein [Chloroflexota bacterium]
MANGSVRQLLLTTNLFDHQIHLAANEFSQHSRILVDPRPSGGYKPHRHRQPVGKYPAQDYNVIVMNQFPAILQQNALTWAGVLPDRQIVVIIIGKYPTSLAT